MQLLQQAPGAEMRWRSASTCVCTVLLRIMWSGDGTRSKGASSVFLASANQWNGDRVPPSTFQLSPFRADGRCFLRETERPRLSERVRRRDVYYWKGRRPKKGGEYCRKAKSREP